ncbi:hypothetical protein SEA_NOSHOW_43 [Mycobacterium phage NoShow]|nr:hypothetical protein SEA_NOSHOW_43 [Mycobacterium phage NoShow]
MRVRVNFTVDLDPETYRERTGEDLTKEEIRKQVQDLALREVLIRINGEGVPCRPLGQNNVYDPRTRTTRSEQLAGKP